MLPADTVTRAAARWLRILRTSTVDQAWSLIQADSKYTDLTQTQYASALEWLNELGLITDGSSGTELLAGVKALPQAQANQLLFERSLEHAAPPWLPDADVLIPDASELPQDAAELADTLDLADEVAWLAIRHVHGRVDTTKRALVGSAGERELISLLEDRWPGSTTYVAEADDGFGYDVLFRHRNVEWHLEVKTTTRRGRLVIYLSRHEHEVCLRDRSWRLIVVGLDGQLKLGALATVRHSIVVSRAPRDLCDEAKWQSTAHQLGTGDLEPGLSFVRNLPLDSDLLADKSLRDGGPKVPNQFAWMPSRKRIQTDEKLSTSQRSIKHIVDP